MTTQEAVERVAAYLGERRTRAGRPYNNQSITSWHGAELTVDDLQALLDAARRPATWTDPEGGAIYDLTRQYLDKDGDIWELSGWLQWTNGTLLPLFAAPACGEEYDATGLPHVIERFGPLTVRPAAAKAAA